MPASRERKDFPPVDRLLLEHLEEAFPDQLPRAAKTTPRADELGIQVATLQGIQYVIRRLRIEYNRQNNPPE